MKKINPSEIPDDIPHRREWIKYQLLIRGYNLVELAKEYGLSRSQPTAALRASYPKWEHIIASKLGTTPQKLWPERYDRYGIPIRKKPGRKSKAELLKNKLSNNNTVKDSHKVKKMGGVRHAQG